MGFKVGEMVHWMRKSFGGARMVRVSSISIPIMVGLRLRAPPGMAKKFDVFSFVFFGRHAFERLILC